MLRIGAFLIESLGSTLAEIADTAKQVEAAGFDGLFVGENHVPEEGVPLENQGAWSLTSAPLVLCMAIAAHTTRLRVGTSVLVLPIHHAIEVAKEAAAIDVMSEGRLVLGVGIGMETNGFPDYGIPFINRVSLLEEGLELMRRAWTEERYSFAGKRYHVKNGSLNLRPRRNSSIPIWLAARTEIGAKRAARSGNGMVIDGAATFQETKDLVAIYRELCAKRCTQPYVILMRDVCIGKSVSEARQKYEESVVSRIRLYWQWQYLNSHYDAWIKQIRSAEEVTWDLATKNRMIAGSLAECAEEIARWQDEIGIDYLMTEFLIPTGGRKQALDDLNAFGREVIPSFAK